MECRRREIAQSDRAKIPELGPPHNAGLPDRRSSGSFPEAGGAIAPPGGADVPLQIPQFHRGGVLLALAAAVASSLGACAARERSTAPWAQHFRPAGEIERAPSGAVEMVASPYDVLASDPEVPGYAIIGRATFREERASESPLAPGSPLERFAMEVGADLVRLGVRPAGTETRTRYVRSRSVLGPPTSSPGAAPRVGGDSERVAVPVEVEVFDHLAIFYRSGG